jgi:hypothetical protein
VKTADFYVQRNIELDIINSSKSKLVMKYKDFNCPWRMYATPNITDKLFMACAYDTEQQLLSLAFVAIADEESVAMVQNNGK